MDLSIIVVSYQARELLEHCLRSVAAHLEGAAAYELIVVDNASADGSGQWLVQYATSHPRVTTLFNKRNMGFAAACNAAIRVCRGDFILLLNSDAQLIDTSVLQGMEFLRRNPAAFGAAGLLLNPDGSRGVSYGHFPDTETLSLEIRNRSFGSLRAVVPGPEEPSHRVDFPCGAFFLVNAAHVRNVGLMDERFFLYFEETDWALRARKLGHDIHFLPFCRAVHLGGGSSRKRRAFVVEGTFHESWILYVRKHEGIRAMLVLFAILGSFFAVSAAKALLQGRVRHAHIRYRSLLALVWGTFGTPSRILSSASSRRVTPVA